MLVLFDLNGFKTYNDTFGTVLADEDEPATTSAVGT